jgi:hypothetical protein
MATVTVSGTGGPFTFGWVADPPVVLREVTAIRGTRRAFPFTLPTATLSRIMDISDVELHPYEPDPASFRGKYYYNTALNRLFVKINTQPVPVWRPTVE